jgi:PAS domain S-box-containing protein
MLACTFQDITYPEDLEDDLGYVNQLLKGIIPTYSMEKRYIRKDGSLVWVNLTVALVREINGEPKYFISVVEDITEHKWAEEELQKSEEKFRLIANTITEVFWMADARIQKIFYISPGYERVWGRTCKSLYENPHSFLDAICQEDRERVFADLEVQKSGQPFDHEYRINWPDGSIRWIWDRGYPVLDKIGKATLYVGIAQDITERKRSEEKMVSLQEQLHQSQKMEAIGRLAGGIAHDFNNLLTVIKGYSQLSLIETKDNDPLKENIEEIKSASERAADLTRQILAFGRRQIMEMKVLDLNVILKNLDKMLCRLIGEDIELATLLAEDLGKVKVDPGQIEQVIINLVVNSRDAMPNGGKLTIETANVELDEEYAHAHIAVKPGRYVMISVSDTGIGMAKEVRERVFEPFYTTKERGKGTGLGLSTVYGIVKQSEGNIWVYSEPGKGTTFKIYLPRVDEPLEEVPEKVIEGELPRGDETILVAEDNEEVRKVIVRILKRQGYNVLEAAHGDEALLVCKEHEGPIHLMVPDVVMPGMSGRELAERLSSIHPNIKVLYMSGYTDNVITHHGILEKGINYIQKPFTVDGLARKVREVLDK